MSTGAVVAQQEVRPVVVENKVSLLAKFAQRYSIEPAKMLSTLKATAFRQRDGGQEVTNEEMVALLVVADQYGLNPFTRELYAFPDRNGGIVPIVSIDGWARIINDQKQMDGVDFKYSDETVKWEGEDVPIWFEAIIYRKDRQHPTRVREFFKEIRRSTQPWKTMPHRMGRHKSLIQCARVAFGFGGIYDEDEGAMIAANASAAPAVVETFNVQAKAAPALEHNPSETLPAAVIPDQAVYVAELSAEQTDAEFVEVPAEQFKQNSAPPIEKVADPTAQQATPSAAPPAAQPAPPAQAPGAASNNEYTFLSRKAKALGVNLAELAKSMNVDMAALTKEGFNALKVELAKIEREQS
jgi:phage recombination protein Bet